MFAFSETIVSLSAGQRWLHLRPSRPLFSSWPNLLSGCLNKAQFDNDVFWDFKTLHWVGLCTEITFWHRPDEVHIIPGYQLFKYFSSVMWITVWTKRTCTFLWYHWCMLEESWSSVKMYEFIPTSNWLNRQKYVRTNQPKHYNHWQFPPPLWHKRCYISNRQQKPINLVS